MSVSKERAELDRHIISAFKKSGIMPGKFILFKQACLESYKQGLMIAVKDKPTTKVYKRKKAEDWNTKPD